MFKTLQLIRATNKIPKLFVPFRSYSKENPLVDFWKLKSQDLPKEPTPIIENKQPIMEI